MFYCFMFHAVLHVLHVTCFTCFTPTKGSIIDSGRLEHVKAVLFYIFSQNMHTLTPFTSFSFTAWLTLLPHAFTLLPHASLTPLRSLRLYAPYAFTTLRGVGKSGVGAEPGTLYTTLYTPPPYTPGTLSHRHVSTGVRCMRCGLHSEMTLPP